MTISEWYPTVAGKRVNSAGGILGECVALVQKYANEVLGVSGAPVFPVPAAKDMVGSRPDAFDWVANTPTGVPPYGSIVVFNGRVGGGYGHTGVAIEGSDTNQVRVIQQNDPYGSGVSIKTYPYNNVSGWLVPKSNNAGTPAQGGTDVVIQGENEFARANQLHVQLLGRPLSRETFNNLVGKSWLNVIEIFSDHKETRQQQEVLQVGRVAVADKWQQQIYDLQAQNKTQQSAMDEMGKQIRELQAQVAVQSDDTKLLNGFGEWLQKIITRLGVKK